MTVQSVTVQLPTRLYNRLKQRAERANRSIEIEMVEAVAGSLPADDILPTELADALAQLVIANDDTLLSAAKARFPAAKSVRLETLHLRRQTDAWSKMEEREAEELTTEQEQFMLLRAQAMSLLMQRGYDVAAILTE